MARVGGWTPDLRRTIDGERARLVRERAAKLLPELLELLGDAPVNRDDLRERVVQIAGEFLVRLDVERESPSIASVRNECQELVAWAREGLGRLDSIGPWLEFTGQVRIAPVRAALEQLQEAAAAIVHHERAVREAVAIIAVLAPVAPGLAATPVLTRPPTDPVFRCHARHTLVFAVLEILDEPHFDPPKWSVKNRRLRDFISLVHQIATGKPAVPERAIREVLAERRRDGVRRPRVDMLRPK